MSLPRMSLHIGDYRKDTAHLDAALHGAYLLLIMHYWATGGLPDDDAQLCRITCMTPVAWRKARPVVQAFFRDGWKHKRIEEEIAVANAKYERRAAAGRRGGEAKAAGKQCSSNATAKPKQPITLTDKEKKDGGGGDARASEAAFDLTLTLGKIAGYPDASYWPPGWVHAPTRVELMLKSGWQPEIMIAAARQAMASKRDGGPNSIAYFEKIFARAHAQARAPLPDTEPAEAPNASNSEQRKLTLLRPIGGRARNGFAALLADEIYGRSTASGDS